MDSNGAVQKLLSAYSRYYDVSTENIEPPFAAEAVFKSHGEQYFLVKEARLSDIDSNEYVFFCKTETLSQKMLEDFVSAAWERGLSRIRPYYGHRNSDISLIIAADTISEDAFNSVKKIKLYKSYKFGFYGWSAFRLLAYETSTERAVSNRRGSDLKKLADLNLSQAG